MKEKELFIVFHSNNKVVDVLNWITKEKLSISEKTIASSLYQLSFLHPEAYLVWCDNLVKDNVDFNKISELIKTENSIISYHPKANFLSKKIGYIDETLFINCNKEVRFPTWQTASLIGATTSKVLLGISKKLKPDSDFSYFLASFSKLFMTQGLLCYSEPALLKDLKFDENQKNKQSIYILFRFVRQHYKKRWIILLFFNLLIYENTIALLPLFYSLFFRSRLDKKNHFSTEYVTAIKEKQPTLDVIIPTIGRKEYLYDFILDLSYQQIKPTRLIIVEQNLNEKAETELDFIKNNAWPFEIKHIFTHQSGACNARNLALKEIKSDWVFFADDDIRINSDFIKEAFIQIKKNKAEAITYSCMQKDQTKIFTQTFQWTGFGSGCSFVKADTIKNCTFKMCYEFGFGEDGDFGMQLRNKGVDILYCPTPDILHLKAPIGGFRLKPEFLWKDSDIQPKPSPTVMVYNLLHFSKEQFLGYKTILFLKFYKNQTIKNPIKYYFSLSKQWNQSVFWAKNLLDRL
jgi:glycosyltransferase involved in cell wall biosynthesis